MKLRQHSNREEFLEKNLKEIAPGARVLDFCCGTGMNGITALQYGAAYVTFTDVRQQTFTNWIENSNYGYDTSAVTDNNHTWKYVDADNIEELPNQVDLHNLDIIIYHGHFYHARNHNSIIKILSDSSAKHFIFETKGSGDLNTTCHWHLEETEDKWNTWVGDERLTAPVGSPSWGLSKMLFEYHGWKIKDVLQQKWKHYGENSEFSPILDQTRVYFNR